MAMPSVKLWTKSAIMFKIPLTRSLSASENHLERYIVLLPISFWLGCFSFLLLWLCPCPDPPHKITSFSIKKKIKMPARRYKPIKMAAS